MPKYSRSIQLPGKTAQDLYDRVSADIDGFMAKTKIGKYEIARDAPAKKVSFKSSLASATLTCSEGAIQLDAELSLLAAPFRPKLDEGINKWLARAFNVAI
jgi:hypothetical protein